MTIINRTTVENNQNEKLASAPFYCFLVLLKHFNMLNVKDFQLKDLEFTLKQTQLEHDKKMIQQLSKTPMFVTWEERTPTGTYELRGCIGTFSKVPIDEGLKTYSLTAALQDPRFPPIIRKEVEKLRCKVSLLMDFKTIYDKVITDTRMHHLDPKKDNSNFWRHIEKSFNILPNDLENTNGIEVHFTYFGKTYHSTFLPEVMVEHELDVQATFEHLLMKALSRDHKRREDLDLLKRIIMKDPKKYIDKVIVYRSTKSCLTYEKVVKVLSH